MSQCAGSVLRRVVVALLGIAGLIGTPAAAQVEFPGAPDERAANLRIYPLDFWSPRVGFGMGAGIVTHNLVKDGSQSLVTVAPAQHEQVATVFVASANPYRARQYVLLSARALHTNRDWFYGLGPGSESDNRLAIGRSALEATVRVGQAFLGRRLIVQPRLGVSAQRVDTVPPVPSSFDSRSHQHLQRLTDPSVGRPGPRQTGVRVGLDVMYDTRNRPAASQRRGGVLLQGTWIRHLDVGSSFVQFDQVDLGAYGFLPLGGTHRLAGRLTASVTRARGQSPVPFYLRSTLGGPQVPGWDRGRFVDSDRLIGSVLYEFPIARALDLVRLEGHLGVHAASVYDNLFQDAGLDLTFDSSLPSGLDSVPLRPAASVGVRVDVLERAPYLFDAAVGLSPEGVSAVRFTFTQDLQALRPQHHRFTRGR